MFDGARDHDVIETAGRRVGIGASIACIAFLSVLLWVAVLGVISIVRELP